jgi:DNA-binding transcriptional ArsR family regulator
MSRLLLYYLNMMNHNNLSNFFKVLQDPIRIRIIEMLQFDHKRRKFIPESLDASDGFCPMDILKILQADKIIISNTKLSYHLKELKENNIIFLVREGKRYFYVFNTGSFAPALRWLNKVKKD